VTAQGHPRTIFKRAIERGNVLVAEATARELGRLTLEEALRLLFLYAEHDPIKFERAALRWLARYHTTRSSRSLAADLPAVSMREASEVERERLPLGTIYEEDR
jgi:hypothetical protein